MNESTIASYLVRLGFGVDQSQLRKFEEAMKKAGGLVEHHTTGVAQQMAKWGGSIVAAFAAVGTATIGLMDKFAMADQNNRLFAMHMFMSQDSARKLKTATDALGASLDDITWDPELHSRFEELWKLQTRLQQFRTPDVASGLKGIRDVRFEFTKLEVQMTRIGEIVTGKLFHSLGGESFLTRLQHFGDWVENHAPQIVAWFEQHLVPIFKDFERVAGDVWKVIMALATSFTRLMGALSGDSALRDGTATFEKFGVAIDKAADYMANFVDACTSAVLTVTDLFNALVDLLHLDFKDFGKDLKQSIHDLTPGGAAVGGISALGALTGAGSVWGLAKLAGRVVKSGAGGVLEGAAGEAAASGTTVAGALAGVAAPAAAVAGVGAGLYLGAKSFDENYGTAFRKSFGFSDNATDNFRKLFGLPPVNEQKPQSPATATQTSAAIDENAQKYGVDPALAHAIAHQESGERQYDKNGDVIVSSAKARGIFQLEPSTAEGMGINPDDAAQNVEGGVRLIAQLLKKYAGNMSEALAAYNWGEGNLDRSIRKHGGFDESYLPAETQNYIRSIEGRLSQNSTSVGDIHVHVTQPNATPDQIADAVHRGTRDAINKHTQANLRNLQGAYAG